MGPTGVIIAESPMPSSLPARGARHADAVATRPRPVSTVTAMARTPSRSAPAARLSEIELPPLDPDSRVWPDRGVRANGADLCIRHAPALVEDAEPALLVHGLGGSALNWTDFAGQLRTRLDVEMIDLPGHGYSGPSPRRNYSLAEHARTVIAYLDRSARGPVHLVGNSMGGEISLRVAAQRPDLVRTLTLISPAVPDVRRLRLHPLKANPLMVLLVLPGLGGAALRRIGRASAESRVRGSMRIVLADPSRYPAQRLAQDVTETEDRAAMAWANEAMLRSMRGLAMNQLFRARSTWAAIGRVQAPTLVLSGDQDKLVAPDLAGYVAAAVPDSRVLVLTDIGHTAMMEDPQTSARAFFGLLEDAAAVARS
jgi:pimeloyl-ACP methyl ester carboxylesterase